MDEGKEAWRKHPCWKCGNKPVVGQRYGYPVCQECMDDEDFDPEEMEMVVIESIGAGRIVSLDEQGIK